MNKAMNKANVRHGLLPSILPQVGVDEEVLNQRSALANSAVPVAGLDAVATWKRFLLSHCQRICL
jgi:hypothetical protein